MDVAQKPKSRCECVGIRAWMHACIKCTQPGTEWLQDRSSPGLPCYLWSHQGSFQPASSLLTWAWSICWDLGSPESMLISCASLIGGQKHDWVHWELEKALCIHSRVLSFPLTLVATALKECWEIVNLWLMKEKKQKDTKLLLRDWRQTYTYTITVSTNTLLFAWVLWDYICFLVHKLKKKKVLTWLPRSRIRISITLKYIYNNTFWQIMPLTFLFWICSLYVTSLATY